MIETTNMYYSAWLLEQNLEIVNVGKIYDQKCGETVQFQFSANDLEVENKLALEYQAETATANIKKYLNCLVTIRNIVYRITNNSDKKHTGEKILEGNSYERKIRRIKVKD